MVDGDASPSEVERGGLFGLELPDAEDAFLPF